MPTKERSLNIRDDVVFERRQWFIQRLGWALMTLVLLLALAGLFGGGPLSRTSATSGTLHTEYERFVRANSRATVHVTARATINNRVRLAIDRNYLDELGLESVQPPPSHVASTTGEIIFEFEAPAGQDVNVAIDATPPAAGFASGTIRALDTTREASVQIKHLIYP